MKVAPRLLEAPLAHLGRGAGGQNGGFGKHACHLFCGNPVQWIARPAREGNGHDFHAFEGLSKSCPLARIYLLRHPAVAVTPGTCYGRSDVPLAADPALIAPALRAALPKDLLIVSSPSSRCLRLAQLLGPVETDARLMEIDFGDWEMRHYDHIERHLIDSWAADPLHFRPPGGETVAEMAARARTAAQHWASAANGRALLIVAHGGPLRAIAGYFRQQAPEEWLAAHFACATLYPIHTG